MAAFHPLRTFPRNANLSQMSRYRLPSLQRQDKAILLAIGVGFAIVVPSFGAMELATGEPFLSGMYAFTIMFSLFAAVPFIVLAAKDITSRAAWSVGAALTASIWGYYVYEGIEYRSSGAATGVDFVAAAIFTLSPLYISLICVWIGKWSRRNS